MIKNQLIEAIDLCGILKPIYAQNLFNDSTKMLNIATPRRDFEQEANEFALFQTAATKCTVITNAFTIKLDNPFIASFGNYSGPRDVAVFGNGIL